MWPWEHAALGYLAVSAVSRVFWFRPPGDTVAIATIFATQFPDLVDKPLGWILEILPSGVSLAHSVFVAVPLCISLYLLGTYVDRRREAIAFSLGYAAGLLGDIFYPALRGRPLNWDAVLYPLVVRDIQGEKPFLEFVTELFDNYLELLLSGGSSDGVGWFLLLEVLLVFGAFLLWLTDGTPGIPPYRSREPYPA